MKSKVKRSQESPSRRSPVAAFLLGLIPGFGQIYVGQRIRGLGVLLFIPAIVTLALWRMQVGGVGFAGPATQAPSAEELRMAWGIGIFLFITVALVYVWSIWDAVRTARSGQPLRLQRIIVLGALMLFVVGWDVIGVDVNKLIMRFPLLGGALRPILWPWPDAVTEHIVETEGIARIDVPCSGTLPEQPAETPGQAYIQVTPTCGDRVGPRQLDGTRKPGTVIHVVGYGFQPNETATFWWEAYNNDAFRPLENGSYVTVDADASGSFTVDVTIPNFSIDGNEPDPQNPTHNKLIMRQEQAKGTYQISEDFTKALSRIVETIFMGLMATLFGLVGAFPLSFLAARNLMGGNPVTLIIYSLIRLLLNILRAIEPLILAVVFVIWVGLGPFAGMIALALHTVSSLGKLFSEAIESIEPGPIEAIQAVGGNWLQVIVYGVIPQVVPSYVSLTMYRWDLNIRSSTIIGAVGGGGIGFILLEFMRQGNYEAAGLCVWLIAIVVSIIDYASSEIREKFV